MLIYLNLNERAVILSEIYFIDEISVYKPIRTKPYKGGQTAKVIGGYLAEQADF